MQQGGSAALAHDDAGRGDPAMVLVHGWGVDRQVMKPIFEDVRRVRRVVSLDLRGFGESGSAGDPVTIRDHADDIAALIEALGLGKVVIVGHSLGGVIAFDLAARHADRVAAAVILEALVVPAAAAVAGLRGVIDGLRSDRHRDVVAGLMRHVIGPRMDAEVRDRLVKGAASHPQGMMAAAMEDMLAFDSVAVAAQVKCPLLYVGTGEVYSDLTRLRALCPQLVTGQLVGGGHYFPLEVPEQLNPMISRFVKTLVPAAAR